MPITAAQHARLAAELRPLTGALAHAAPPERLRLIREALERAGVLITWDEWAILEPELLRDTAEREDERGQGA